MKKSIFLLLILISFFLSAGEKNPVWFNKNLEGAGSITMKDPEMIEHGMVTDMENAKYTYSLLDVAKYNGHLCPGSVAGFLMTRDALKLLYGKDMPERGGVKVTASVPKGTAYVSGYLTGALSAHSMQAKEFKIDLSMAKDGALTVIYERKDNGQKVKAVFYKKKAVKLSKNPKLFKKLADKVDNKKANEKEIKQFGTMLQEIVASMIKTGKGFYTIEKI